jgi:hypothetical protein
MIRLGSVTAFAYLCDKLIRLEPFFVMSKSQLILNPQQNIIGLLKSAVHGIKFNEMQVHSYTIKTRRFKMISLSWTVKMSKDKSLLRDFNLKKRDIEKETKRYTETRNNWSETEPKEFREVRLDAERIQITSRCGR